MKCKLLNANSPSGAGVGDILPGSLTDDGDPPDSMATCSPCTPGEVEFMDISVELGAAGFWRNES